jgi:hypothetical protein
MVNIIFAWQCIIYKYCNIQIFVDYILNQHRKFFPSGIACIFGPNLKFFGLVLVGQDNPGFWKIPDLPPKFLTSMVNLQFACQI